MRAIGNYVATSGLPETSLLAGAVAGGFAAHKFLNKSRGSFLKPTNLIVTAGGAAVGMVIAKLLAEKLG